MPNGKKYLILENRSLSDNGGISYIYQRVDSMTANVYQYCADIPGGEFLIDSLASQIGDSSRAVRDEICSSNIKRMTFCLDMYVDSLFQQEFL